MTAANPASTPIGTSKTAALCRVLDSVPKGYIHSTHGTCDGGKVEKLAQKFHDRYGIGCSPAQRITRRKRGLANAVLVLYWPKVSDSDPVSESVLDSALGLEQRHSLAGPIDATTHRASLALTTAQPVHWLLLATEGTGPIHDQESLRSVLETPRLAWLGYELVRRTNRDRMSWTWRRTKQDMADLYALLGEQLNRHQDKAVAETLMRVARQPGFHGIREQSWALCQYARRRGYAQELPFLYHVQKASHGYPLWLTG